MAHLHGRTSNGDLTRIIDPQTARRQLHLSLGLLGALAVATCAGLSLRPAPAAPTQARLTVQQPQMIQVQHAQNMRRD